jgi:hypothetical protein
MTACRRIALVCLMLMLSSKSYSATKIIEWENAAFCRFETRFDPAKYDTEALRNTINVLFGDGFYQLGIPNIGLDRPGGHLTSNTEQFQNQCEMARQQARSLAVIALPGIEDYRAYRLEELDDYCHFGTIESRAASGDVAALREYTKSAEACSPFIDALEGKTDIRAVWRDVIETECRKNFDPVSCRASFLAADSRPNPDEAIKLDVLTDGWGNCSVRYLKTSDMQTREAMRDALIKSFRRRFKIKAYPCSN